MTIEKATVQVSLSSRVACIGPNGAGKSTLIKCLTGEVEPTTGTVWQHPNARIGYIAQHAFHHIESHMDKTPNEYIRWRYAGGDDREAIAKDTMQLTDKEKELQAQVIEFTVTDPETAKITKSKRVIARLTNERKTNKSTKENDYEVQFKAPCVLPRGGDLPLDASAAGAFDARRSAEARRSSRLRGISARHRRRRDPRNIHVVAAAAPRDVPAGDPGAATTRGNSVAVAPPRNIRAVAATRGISAAAAAAAPRDVFAGDPGAATTRGNETGRRASGTTARTTSTTTASRSWSGWAGRRCARSAT